MIKSNAQETYQSLDLAVKDMSRAGIDTSYVSGVLDDFSRIDADVAEHLSLFGAPKISYVGAEQVNGVTSKYFIKRE